MIIGSMPFILGVRVDNFTITEALERVQQLFSQGEQHLITTPNPEFLVKARRDPRFRQVLNSAKVALPDGVGLLLAARFLGVPLKTRVPGVDFVDALARFADQKGATLYLLGGEEGVAKQAAEQLKSQNKKLKVLAEAGPQSYPEILEQTPSLLQNIRQAAPDILLVAFGQGRQETWITRHLSELPSVKLAMGVGGALDFIAGKVRRAPHFVRFAGLEWLWRLILQPWRLPRVWRATVIFPLLVFKEWYKMKKS